ncbi:MAG: fumarylacetoacetase [Steroidobacteraceae bacterium]|jgi:fumarylacetoacetase
MTATVNATHDPHLRSWVDSANSPGTDFPIQNLPLGVFRRAASGEPFRAGVAIGEQILDLRALHERGRLQPSVQALLEICCEPSLNHLMSMGQAASGALRAALSEVLREGSAAQAWLHESLVPQAQAEFALPATIGDYTDFYTSIHHASAVGKQFRPDNPLLPNYRWIPIAYHGRSSTIRVSEHDFHRPVGQRLAKGAAAPELGATQRLDFELEVGVFVGPGNAPGRAIPIKSAESHVFGLCLLNDWSARDIQGWEYQPLGPFLSKNFATTISPWIITLEALAPFRAPFSRPAEDPQPLSYLQDPAAAAHGALDIQVEVSLQTSRMRAQGANPQRLALSNFKYAYWTIAQLVAHHTINGCELRPGDLFGSGTMSGPSPTQAGSLVELTGGGQQLIAVGSSETRAFLEDGDRVVLRAWCEGAGRRRIGFGSAAATVLPVQTG